MKYILGIDSGLTVTKAAVFDSNGRTVAVSRRRLPQLLPQPHRVERDMHMLWQQTAEVIKEAIHHSGCRPSDIAVVSVTAHGDGVYLLDHQQNPLGPGILSLDTRAHPIVCEWRERGLDRDAITLSGQVPHPSAPSALLSWIQRHQPERYKKIGTILSCKDWLRYCLSGSLGTDMTEASTSFTAVETQQYDGAILQLYGLDSLYSALPEMAPSAKIVGAVTAKAAGQTGLLEGTPVAAGLHDVTASALGIGGHSLHNATIVAGTYSINEVLADQPKLDPGWFCRNSIEPGLWHCMSISPASATNYDWFIDTFFASEREVSVSIHQRLNDELTTAMQAPSATLFHPYLFGSPFGGNSSGGFLGVHGWHDRGTLLKAVIEGIVFNHRWHVEKLQGSFPIQHIHLTGGISRNTNIAQMFADILGLPVDVSTTEEPAAWGAALCGGAATGLFESAFCDPRELSTLKYTYQPRTERTEFFDARYRIFCQAAEQLQPIWDALASHPMPQGL